MGRTAGIIIIFIGLSLLIYGVFLIKGISFHIPLDIVVKKKGYTVYFPIGTSIVISVLLTVLASIFLRK